MMMCGVSVPSRGDNESGENQKWFKRASGGKEKKGAGTFFFSTVQLFWFFSLNRADWRWVTKKLQPSVHVPFC